MCRSAKRSGEKFLISFFKKLVIILVVLIATLVLIEVGLRLWGHIAVNVKKPDLNRPSLNEADYIISCFGDSYTAGVGASSPEFSYPSQLERILNNRHQDSKIIVLNEGVPGLNSSELVRRMERRLSLYSRAPDLIILTSFNNNLWNLHLCSALLEGYVSIPASKQWIEKIEGTKVGKLAVILNERGKSLALRLANTSFDEWVSTACTVFDVNKPEERAFLSEWIRHDMLRIKDIAESLNSKVLFGPCHLSSVNDIMIESASSLSIPFCKPIKSRPQWLKLGWISKDNWHPNDRGYTVFAEHIADCIETNGFLPKRPNTTRYKIN